MAKKFKFKFGDKVTHKVDGQGLVIGIDRVSQDQPYLVLYGDYTENSSGANTSTMTWPSIKDLTPGWRKRRKKK